MKDNNDGTGGYSTASDLYVEDAWVGSTLGGLLEEYFITRGDVRWIAQVLDIAENNRLQVGES